MQLVHQAQQCDETAGCGNTQLSSVRAQSRLIHKFIGGCFRDKDKDLHSAPRLKGSYKKKKKSQARTGIN